MRGMVVAGMNCGRHTVVAVTRHCVHSMGRARRRLMDGPAMRTAIAGSAAGWQSRDEHHEQQYELAQSIHAITLALDASRRKSRRQT